MASAEKTPRTFLVVEIKVRRNAALIRETVVSWPKEMNKAVYTAFIALKKSRFFFVSARQMKLIGTHLPTDE